MAERAVIPEWVKVDHRRVSDLDWTAYGLATQLDSRHAQGQCAALGWVVAGHPAPMTGRAELATWTLARAESWVALCVAADQEPPGADAMVATAHQNGVEILEVEYVTGWCTPDGAQREKERTVFHMAGAFGVRHVNAGLLERLPIDVMTTAFAALCERAGPDLTVALEFMPYSGVPDLATAWEIVRHVPNGGLIVDNWHWARAGQKPSDLDGVPPERIVSVQLCDVREHPMDPLRAESLSHRLPPGQGYGDSVGLVRALADHGVRPQVMAVEVISDELVGQGVGVAARRCADAARTVLTTAH